MLWIKCNNKATKGLFDADIMDEPIEFSDNGTAQVTNKVGEALVKRYGAIEPLNDEEGN